eukprot:1224011-Amphidinium_carterae.1
MGLDLNFACSLRNGAKAGQTDAHTIVSFCDVSTHHDSFQHHAKHLEFPNRNFNRCPVAEDHFTFPLTCIFVVTFAWFHWLSFDVVLDG